MPPAPDEGKSEGEPLGGGGEVSVARAVERGRRHRQDLRVARRGEGNSGESDPSAAACGRRVRED
eukprot:11212851-Lingulodinium_polyedra.AAC.1